LGKLHIKPVLKKLNYYKPMEVRKGIHIGTWKADAGLMQRHVVGIHRRSSRPEKCKAGDTLPSISRLIILGAIGEL
jgi:hypothetical protein